MKGTLLDSSKRKAGRFVSFIAAVSILSAITACDQTPDIQSPTPMPQATATRHLVVRLDPSGTPFDFVGALVANPTSTAVSVAPTSLANASCTPTTPHAEGPFYKPNAPERTAVGKGHILNGVVKSTRDCAPISRAKIEFWQVNPNGQYDDNHRATMYAGASGVYSFESNFPPSYESRPPHIHVRVSAQGYHTLITQYYPKDGETEGAFDLVIAPDER